MRIERTERFERAYRKLPSEQRERARKALALFLESPTHPSLHVKRVQGTAGIWEARAGRRLRFTFERIPDGIRLRNIDDHDACLRKP